MRAGLIGPRRNCDLVLPSLRHLPTIYARDRLIAGFTWIERPNSEPIVTNEQMYGLRSTARPMPLARHACDFRIVCALGAAAVMLGGCSICDELEMTDGWHNAIVGEANAAVRNQNALAPPSAPDCRVKGAKKPSQASGAPDAFADPNLLEVARLELERDCYKAAEKEVRRDLEKSSAIAQGLEVSQMCRSRTTAETR